MKRYLSYLIICALPLLSSCGKEQDKQVGFKDSTSWQKAQWDRCSQRFQEHLAPEGREEQMRTLDAAYVAILKSEETEENSYTVPFSCDGAPCEAHIVRSEGKGTVTVVRRGKTVGVFSMDGDVFTGESAGIRFYANPLVVNEERVEADVTFFSDGVVLATLKADGPIELVEVCLVLPEGISLRGNVEAASLWSILRAMADEDSQEKVTPLVEKASSAIHVNVYYNGDTSQPHARVGLVPLHYLNRYDDYWTWEKVIITNDGDILDKAWNALGGFDEASVKFYKTWKSLLPHIIK